MGPSTFEDARFLWKTREMVRNTVIHRGELIEKPKYEEKATKTRLVTAQVFLFCILRIFIRSLLHEIANKFCEGKRFNQ
jgi:hypothetical protein